MKGTTVCGPVLARCEDLRASLWGSLFLCSLSEIPLCSPGRAAITEGGVPSRRGFAWSSPHRGSTATFEKIEARDWLWDDLIFQAWWILGCDHISPLACGSLLWPRAVVTHREVVLIFLGSWFELCNPGSLVWVFPHFFDSGVGWGQGLLELQTCPNIRCPCPCIIWCSVTLRFLCFVTWLPAWV